MTQVSKIEDHTAAPTTTDPMVSMIERVAMSPDLPIERLERMMDLKDRHEQSKRDDAAREAEKAYNGAMAKAQSEMPTVAKSKANSHTRSTYADLSDIEEQAMPIAYKHGFAVSFNPGGVDQNGNLLINWSVMHEGGHTKSGQAGFPLDAAGSQGKANKTGIQAMGSTMTYARRYLICNLFNIATDDDTDGNAKQSSQAITEEQTRTLGALIEKSGMDPEVFHKAFGHRDPKNANLSEFPAEHFDNAMKRLNGYMAAKKEVKNV